ncbi:MAG: DeoR/GlpR transcriptional regulator [Clostridia bacterium]|nr:DeoR/GlpR transcriptional regulator [Clostridia bacterium]
MKDKYKTQIVEILRERQYATIDELSKILFVSPSTVRRNLNALEQGGIAVRTHGGVKLKEESNSAPSFTFRIHQNIPEKKKIALAAIKLIHDGDIVFLDGSTSSFFIAEYLSEFKNIRVITNGIDTLSLLSRNGVNAYSTGGYVQDENRSALVGKYAESMICCFHADIAFFSAQSVSADGEIYDCFEEENFIRAVMMKNSSKNVLLVDDTKFGRKSPYRLCHLRSVDYLITNTPLTFTEEIPTAQIIAK